MLHGASRVLASKRFHCAANASLFSTTSAARHCTSSAYLESAPPSNEELSGILLRHLLGEKTPQGAVLRDLA